MMHDNFSSQADLYAKYRPAYPKALYDFILQHVERKETAWDCATGSGQVAGYLAKHFEKVKASDISEQQMSHASQRSTIDYIKTPAEQTDFEDDSFDLITVAQAIHWFDFEQFYREVKRTGKPNSLIAVIGYGMVQVNGRINPLIKQFYDDSFEKYFRENRRYLDDRYETIPFPFEEIKSPAFSISYQWSLDDMEGYFNSWSAVQKIKEEEGYNPVDKCIEKIRMDWSSEEIKEVTFPVFMRLGRINK